MSNLTLPGNPRYQPANLQEHFGYDNLYRAVAEVEIAALKTLGDIHAMPPADFVLLTPAVEQSLLSITTTEVDKVEREVTKHDIRAWVRIAQERVPAGLRRWIHIPLTSYDVIDTARALQFLRAHRAVIHPLAEEVIRDMKNFILVHAGTPQIGRTHGQHAVPITVGFWMATILSRVILNIKNADYAASWLVGKISGAVGAYNAQVSSGIAKLCGQISFEDRVLGRLGLPPAPISTQIAPPEPLANYLFACVKLSAAFGQLGRDGRHLMRTEIGELAEPFGKGQVGSSTMAHKRNPITWEGLESAWLKTKNEFGKVLDTLISDHQRDLVGSAISRDFPVIVVNLATQMNTLTRKVDGASFIRRLAVDADACERNLELEGDAILAEPVYIALQMSGYMGDAHELVNREALNLMKDDALHITISRAVEIILDKKDPEAAEAWNKCYGALPAERKSMLYYPASYVGLAEKKALEIVASAERYLQTAKG